MTTVICRSCGEVHKGAFKLTPSELTCPCGGHRCLPSELKPRKPLRRTSRSVASGTGRNVERRSLKRGRGFAASPEQQAKVRDLPCIVCNRDRHEGVEIHAAHVYPRRKQSCECADGVVPMCSTDHAAYDDQNSALDLLPSLVTRGYHAELVHAVAAHGVPIVFLLEEVTGTKWEPALDPVRGEAG